MSKVDFIGDGPSGAVFSEDRAYRYSLWRRWEPDCHPSRMMAAIGLNPSTADEFRSDPTITRLMNYAKKFGYGGIAMLNLFAFRATDPKVMKQCGIPIGPLNNEAIQSVVAACGNKLLCCWGNHGEHMKRGAEVVYILDQTELLVFKITKTGQPSHPLYLPASLLPVPWIIDDNP